MGNGSCYYQAALQLQLMMSAYTVMDSVNKYRHGVLVGNFVEDKFGKDLHEKGPNPDEPKLTTTKTHHDLAHSLHKPNSFIAAQQPDRSQFYSTARGLSGEPYKRPESETSYNIFHQQEVAKQVPVLENNPKREAQLEAENRLYEQTRAALANKFSRPEGQDVALDSLSQEIPDILTGEIFRPKPSTGSEVKPEQKGKTRIEGGVSAKSVNPYSAFSIVKPQVQKFEEVEYAKFVYPHHKGEQRDLLFGHGVALEDFQRRQLATTYDLSYNQKVPPQTQVNSFYEPDAFHEKAHQPKLPAGETRQPWQERVGRPYQPYTGTFDKNHLKHEYLRK